MPPKEFIRQFDPNLSLARAHTIPAAWYFDPEVARAERQYVFGDSWQAVGRADQVSKPASFLTANVAGEPVVVVRDEAGVLRAFSNVCRHRAARVVNEADGCAKKLRCRYHGWTYDLAGRLRGTPEFDGVEDFCREDQGLPQLRVGVWGPLVWIHLGKTQPDLDQILMPLTARCRSTNLEGLTFVERREYVLQCNWKVFVDNYLDGGYHVNTVHPGLADVIDYTHYRTEIAGLTSVQISPLKKSDSDSNISTVRAGDTAYYWWIYPNFMINLYEGIMDTNLVLPLTPTSCRVVFDFYFAEAEGADRRRFTAESMAVAHQIQLEDVGICEEVQIGLASRSYDTGRFSVRREAAGYHFHQLLAKNLSAWKS